VDSLAGKQCNRWTFGWFTRVHSLDFRHFGQKQADSYGETVSEQPDPQDTAFRKMVALSEELGLYGPPPQYMDNPKAVGAPEGWCWGYLPCGCRNDGYGNHVRS